MCNRACGENVVDPGSFCVRENEVNDIAFLKDGLRGDEEWHPVAGHKTDAPPRRAFKSRRCLAEPTFTRHKLTENHVTAWITVFLRRACREQTPKHLPGGPRHGRNGGDAQAFVHLRASEVVNACDDALHTVRLARYPSRDDVRVVTAANSREGVSPLDSCALEGLPVESHSGDRTSLEIVAQSKECLCLLIDDCHGVATVIEFLSKEGTDAPASEDDDVHVGNATPPAPCT